MIAFAIEAPWNGGVITAEHDGGLMVDLEGCELSARAQTLCSAVLYYLASRHVAGHPSSTITFSAGPDLVFIDTLDVVEAGECLRDLLAAIRISDSLGAMTEKAA